MTARQDSLTLHRQADLPGNLLDMSLSGLREDFSRRGLSAYRADQVWRWIWKSRVRDIAEMTNVPLDLRNGLADRWRIAPPLVSEVRTSADGTIKFLLVLEDGRQVESVLIFDEDHFTQCLSSQVGCALECAFCRTGQMGFTRNLTPGEIAGQILAALDHLGPGAEKTPLRNLVFMGMGEPLLNWPNVRAALETILHPSGLDFSRRRITLSTVGLMPSMHEFGRSGLGLLAVSLHAPEQELRERIMPRAAAALPLPQLVQALRTYPLKPRERITIEYLMLDGVNDDLARARQLVRILDGVRCKVNLIAFNPCAGIPFAPSPAGRILDFERFLWSKGLTATLRKSKGQDICAACGQLQADTIDTQRKQV